MQAHDNCRDKWAKCIAISYSNGNIKYNTIVLALIKKPQEMISLRFLNLRQCDYFVVYNSPGYSQTYIQSVSQVSVEVL